MLAVRYTTSTSGQEQVSSDTSATQNGTKGDGSGKGKRRRPKRKRGLLLGLFGTLPKLITAAAAMITAIGGIIFGATKLASPPQPQPTVFVTVTSRTMATPASSPPAVSPANDPSQVTTPPSSTPASSPSTPASISGTDLASLSPVRATVANLTTAAPQRIGTTTYSDAIRFSCSSWSDTYYSYYALVYNVSGYKTLNATFGIPDDAANAADNSAAIRFFNVASPTELGQPVVIAAGSPKHVHLNLQGSAQLKIACIAAKTNGTHGDDIDVVIGNATLNRS